MVGPRLIFYSVYINNRIVEVVFIGEMCLCPAITGFLCVDLLAQARWLGRRSTWRFDRMLKRIGGLAYVTFERWKVANICQLAKAVVKSGKAINGHYALTILP